MGIYTESEKKEMHETAMNVLETEKTMSSQLTMMNYISALLEYLENRPTLENLNHRLTEEFKGVVRDYIKLKAKKGDLQDHVLGVADRMMAKEKEAGDE